MTTQVKLLKNLFLMAIAALIIILAPPLNVIGEEIVTLTTIMPSQDTLRVERGAVGTNYRQVETLTDEDIGDDNLLIEGNVGIGTTEPNNKLEVIANNDYSAFKVEQTGTGSIASFDRSGGWTVFRINNEGAVTIQAENAVTDGLTISDTDFTNAINLGGNRIIGTTSLWDGDGNVGIGTTTPEFNLSLAVDGGIISTGTFGSGATLTTSGTGVRMFWYPRKGAFRAGRAYLTEWDNSMIGNYSVAMGSNTLAYGSGSVAMGDDNEAWGSGSVAMGYGSQAISSRSIAMGYSCYARGDGSVAMGNDNTADGSGAVALGRRCEATGDYSVAMGNNSDATSTACVALGYSAESTGYYSMAAGFRAKAVNPGCFVWADSQSADYSSTNSNQFRIRAAGGIFHAGTSIHDIAEFMDVLKEDDVREGQIVSLAQDDKLGKSKGNYDENLIGVVSGERTTTLHLANENASYEDTVRLPIALVGRVYVKVNNESGQIRVGDPITSSSQPGIGMKATRTGKIIGYAMEEIDFKESRQDEILVFVNTGYYVSGEDCAKLDRIGRLENELDGLHSEIEILKEAIEKKI
ncbi:MAG: hypothetical protein JSV93_03860 [Candidatus Omnitrophota bacterium]|nr:MAG: hypothetical protein JSV93_03860 [Candidatus Omnitrophota bacterium]